MTDYRRQSLDCPSGAYTTITAELPVSGFLQSADVSIFAANSGPVAATIVYGDLISLSFTQLKSGMVRNESSIAGNGLDRLSWQGRLDLGAKQAAHPQLRALIRNDTGSTVAGVNLTYEVSE